MATFVWTGTLNNNPTTGANWNVGGVAQVAAPTAADNVAFGAGVGATNNACTIPTATTIVGRSYDFTGYTGTLTFASTTAAITIGDGTAGTSNIALKLVAGMTLTLTGIGTITFASTSATQQSINSGGKTVPNITLNGIAGSWVLAANMTSSGVVTLTNGAFDDGGFTKQSTTFVSPGTTTRSLTLTGTWNITSTATATVWNIVSTGLTFSGGSSTIALTTTSTNTRTMVFGASVGNYGTLTYTVAGSTGTLAISNAPVFSVVNWSDASNARIITTTSAGFTILTAAGFNVSGTSGHLTSIATQTAGVAHTLTINSGLVSVDFVSVKDSTATGNTPFYAGANSTNVSGNTNWTFTTPPPEMKQGNLMTLGVG